MQLRRTGLLLPLAQALLALVVGCSHQSAEPQSGTSGDASELAADSLSSASPNRTTAHLQHSTPCPICSRRR